MDNKEGEKAFVRDLGVLGPYYRKLHKGGYGDVAYGMLFTVSEMLCDCLRFISTHPATYRDGRPKFTLLDGAEGEGRYE